MTETELIAMARDVNAQYAVLFGQIISMNFAMILAIFYFLNRAEWRLKAGAYIMYMVGMLMFTGMLLQQANFKAIALRGLEAIPADVRSQPATEFLDISGQWVFTLTAFFLNAALWVLIACVTYLLFVWRKDRPSAPAP